MRKRTATAVLLAAVLLPRVATAESLYVAEPKVYDNYELEQLLRQAEASLASLQLAKAEALTSAIGTLQGAQITTTQVGVSATELPTPQVVQTESAAPSTVTTTSSVTPEAPTLSAAPAVTLPSDLGPSAIDTLEEILQLQLRVANLRLLLQGALSDQVSVIGNSVVPRTGFTFGFPITISTPRERLYRNAVAEVEVKVKIDPNCSPPGAAPGLKAVLPREKTYNVAQIRSKATSLGTGVVSGIFNLGGNWIRGQSRYFLVKDQDTLAYEGEGGGGEIVFGWRFKPVLGQRKVQPGLRQVFAQLTFPVPPGAGALGTAEVTTRWRRLQRKTGALGEVVPGTERGPFPFPLRPVDVGAGPVTIDLLDLGNGTLRATLKGTTLFAGTTFRLGGATATTVAVPTDNVQLDLKPLAIVRQGLFVGVRGQQERPLLATCSDPGVTAALLPGCAASPSIVRDQARVAQLAAAAAGVPIPTTLCGDPYAGFSITQIDRSPTGIGRTRVLITLDRLRPVRGPGDLPMLTVLGGKVYGLRDAPYQKYDPVNQEIEFVTDDATLAAATAVEVVRPLWGPDYHAVYPLTHATMLAVSKHTVVSDSGNLLLALEGRGLNGAGVTVAFPSGSTLAAHGPGHALVTIPKAKRTGLKQLVLQDGAGPPVLVDLSKAPPPAKAAAPAKPELLPADPVKIGAGVRIKIAWKNKGELKAVRHEKTAQTIVATAANSATVQLADPLTARSGTVLLEVEFKGGTKRPLTLKFVDQHVAVVSP